MLHLHRRFSDVFTNIILYKQLRVMGGKNIWLGNLENRLICLGDWELFHKNSLRVTEHEPLAPGDGA